MIQLFYTILEAAAAAVILVPLFLILNTVRFRNVRRTALYVLFVIYLAGIYAVVGLPNVTYIRFDLNLNIVPILPMLSALRDSLLNVLLFVPMGFFLTLLWKFFRSPSRTVLFGFFLSLSIEILQIFTFRATDVNDLITNTLGTFFGWLLARLVTKCCPKLALTSPKADLPILFGSAFAVMFFFQPLIWKLIY